MKSNYRIRVKGKLDPHWSSLFEELAMRPQDDGTTLIVGELPDQAALHGVIARIRDLGLTLISISRDDSHAQQPAEGGEATRSHCG